MGSAQQSVNSIASLAARLADELQRAKNNIGRSADSASEDLAAELRQLQDDLAAIQGTISAFGKTAGAEASKTASRVGAVGAEAAREFAADARDRAHSTVADFEEFARRNPLWVLGCALGLGFILGLLMRRQ